MFYFAYGSNMLTEQMDTVCKNYKSLGAARLMNYRLAFNRESQRWGHGVADIVYNAGSIMWGVLYEIDETCLAGLNQKESLGVGYEHLYIGVDLQNGKHYHAMTYTVINKLEQELLPSRAYLDTLISGAKQHGLPLSYIRELMTLQAAVTA